jgi:hypothetical protein
VVSHLACSSALFYVLLPLVTLAYYTECHPSKGLQFLFSYCKYKSNYIGIGIYLFAQMIFL